MFYSKFKVDGITKFVETNGFVFDNTFNESETTKDIYDYSVKPIIQEIFNNGCVTVFAYG